MVLADDLGKLSGLREKGGLTDDEFARAKERVLAGEAACHGESVVTNVNRFRLSRSDRWIGGVCGGLAHLTGAEAWIWRLAFTGLFVFGGFGLLLYGLLWIFVPRE